ncbi:MAG: TMEM43 family protein [Proteobacteria bacterium]|nr:TMEM43 family protein [Pseudomonadota bacterium]
MKLSALKTKSRASLGVFTLLCALGLMWSGTVRSLKDQSNINAALGRAITIDAASPDPGNNNKLVVAAGRLSSGEMLEDELLKPGPYLALKRRVEMFQWSEERSSDDSLPEYSINWHPGQIDFFRFRKPQGHENPLLKFQPELKTVGQSTFSGFDGSRIIKAISDPARLILTKEMLRDPSLEIVDNKIVIRRDPSSTELALGDMRVWYESLPPGDYTVLAVQADERSLLGSERSDQLVIQAGLLDAEQFLEQQGEQASESSNGILYMGTVLLCIGLLSILGSFSQRLDLRPKVNLQGQAAAIFLSVAISLTVLLILLILSLVS